jgi:hypothetical protein
LRIAKITGLTPICISYLNRPGIITSSLHRASAVADETPRRKKSNADRCLQTTQISNHLAGDLFHRCRISVCRLYLVYGPLPLLPVCVLFHVTGGVNRLSSLLSPGSGQNSATRISGMASGNHAGSTPFLTHLPSVLLDRFVDRSAIRTSVVEARWIILKRPGVVLND